MHDSMTRHGRLEIVMINSDLIVLAVLSCIHETIDIHTILTEDIQISVHINLGHLLVSGQNPSKLRIQDLWNNLEAKKKRFKYQST